MKTTRITNQAGPKCTDPRVYTEPSPITGQMLFDLVTIGEDVNMKELEELLNRIWPYEVRLRAKKNK